MKNLKLFYKIVLLNVAVMMAFVLVIGFVYSRIERNLFAQKKMEVRHAVETMCGAINHFVAEVGNGGMTVAAAQQQALDAVGQTRYAGDNYFWIHDMTPRMVMHPIKPELNGRDLTQYLDPSGKALFVEMVREVEAQQAGFVDYQWAKPGLNEPVAKISYIMEIPEWGWVVGSGLYLDDLQAELARIRDVIFSATVLMFFFALVMTYLAAYSISEPLSRAVAMIKAIGKGNLDSRLEMRRTDEVGVMAAELNKFADNMQHEILAAFESLAAGDFSFKAQGVIRAPLEKTNAALSELIARNRKITAELKEREHTIKLLLNSTAEGVYGLDQDGICTFCNESAQKMLGYDESLLVGRAVHELIAHTGPDGSGIPAGDCLLHKILSTAKPYHCDDAIFWVRDGSWINVEYRMHPVLRGKRAVGAVVTFIDNTEKKKLLEQRMRTTQLVALGELAAGLAHEVNNPISGVINYAQILLNKKSRDPQEKDLLARIIKEGERVVTIVQNLLSFSYKDRDSMVPIRLADIVDEPIALVQQRLLNDGICLDVDIADDLPKIVGNAQKLEQVLINMVNNSRHALNEKFPRHDPDKILRISAEKVGEGDACRVRMTVWDQGSGIQKENLDKIFNTFFTTKPAGVGTGLGLSVSHDILAEHAATINVESDFGLFTKIEMEFPVHLPNSTDPSSTPLPAEQPFPG